MLLILLFTIMIAGVFSGFAVNHAVKRDSTFAAFFTGIAVANGLLAIVLATQAIVFAIHAIQLK